MDLQQAIVGRQFHLCYPIFYFSPLAVLQKWRNFVCLIKY